jgi:hypothetical protein
VPGNHREHMRMGMELMFYIALHYLMALEGGI